MGSRQQADPIQGIAGLIDKDETFLLEHYPNIKMILEIGMTYSGGVTGPKTKRRYNDPSFEQYAVIHGKRKSLQTLLTLRGADPNESVIHPRGSNTKHDLFTLAILEQHDDILADLIKAIPDPQRRTALMSFESTRHDTPLSEATKGKNWKAVFELVRAGANPLLEPINARCACIEVILHSREDSDLLSELIDASGPRGDDNVVENAILHVKWDANLRQSANGTNLASAIPDYLQGQGQGSALPQITKAVGAVYPIFLEGRSASIERANGAQKSPTTGEEKCDGSGCTKNATTRCTACGKWFCEECATPEEHGCSS